MIEHEFGSDNKCKHCNVAYDAAYLSKPVPCRWRPDPPAAARAIPPSIVDDHDGINEHRKRIRAEEDAALKGETPIAAMDDAAYCAHLADILRAGRLGRR